MNVAYPRDASNAHRVPKRDSQAHTPVMDDATAAIKDARIVIMNPPFTNRRKMGQNLGDYLRG